MAKNARIASVAGDTISFNDAGTYTIEAVGNSGNIKIRLDNGKSYVMKRSEFEALDTLNLANADAHLVIDIATLGSDAVTGPGYLTLNGISFTQAGPTGGFEISHNLDTLIGSMISTYGVEHAVGHLSINGSMEDTFKAIWDYLDDAYVAGGNYYNLALNETFVRLGVEYLEYLASGGEPLTDVTAKFTADNSDPDTIPERNQSMHDNLLGNLNLGALQDRFGSNPTLLAELRALIPDEYENRPYYDGADQRVGGPIHDAVRAFDWDKGWERPDYLDRDYSALIHPDASRDANNNGVDESMYYGNGNPNDDWNVVRHEGAQVELGLKIKHRGGDEYAEASIDADGVAHYHVLSGTQPNVANRAEWNFDFAATDYSPDQDFTYVVELDLDPTEGVDFTTVYSPDMPFDTSTGTGNTFQNSSNIAFYRNFIDSDPDAAGVQPYAFGEGEFNVRISAYDADTGALIAVNEVVVHVGA